MDAHEFLKALTMVLCVAAVTTVIFQKLRQPVVLGYILAGLVVGPHLPIPLVADINIVQTLSELGVILLMFSLGLEFTLRKLFSVGPTAGLTAIVQCSVMIWLGFVVGQAFGWTTIESIFVGAIIAISSTTIIARAFDEQGIRGKLRELVVGILIVEDLIAILLMAILTAVAASGNVSARTLFESTVRLSAFLVALIAVGLLVIPRTIRAIHRLKRSETLLVASIGICFGIALLAHWLGYSVALGAFLAGVLVAESGHGKTIEHLIEPVRDMFAAVFFVSVGMLIDPLIIAAHWKAIVVLTLVVIVGKLVSVFIGAFLTGNGTRTSVQTGMSLAQIGEFSFIIAALGISLKATGDFLYPIAVAVSAMTTMTTPWLIRASGPTANFVDRKLPRPLQTFAALYGSWIENARHQPVQSAGGLRRRIGLLFLDSLILSGIVITAAVFGEDVSLQLQRALGFAFLSQIPVAVGAIVLAAPFCYGIFRIVQSLGASLAERVFPTVQDTLDLAAAPRRVFRVTLQLAALFLVGLPILALTQPFLKSAYGALLFIVIMIILGIVFWRSATNFAGHVRAGSEMIIEVLAKQSHRLDEEEDSLSQIKQLLPGLGDPVSIVLSRKDSSVGSTLAQINLRGITGANVIAITRAGKGLSGAIGHENLRAGDVLALVGTHDALKAATTMLRGEKRARRAERSG